MIIAGYKKVDFETKEKLRVNGYNVYLVDNFDKQLNYSERGSFCEKVFFSEDKFKDLKIHELFIEETDVRPVYNKYGKIQHFII